EFHAPLGFRNARVQVQNLEMQLAKERQLLHQQEEEIRYELTQVFQNLDRFHQTAQSARNQREAAEERILAAEAEQLVRSLSLEGVDLQLRAVLARRDAELQYSENLVRYNQALSEFHLRKGTILNCYNVTLLE